MDAYVSNRSVDKKAKKTNKEMDAYTLSIGDILSLFSPLLWIFYLQAEKLAWCIHGFTRPKGGELQGMR